MRAITSNKWVLVLVIFLVLSNLALVIFAFSNSAPKDRGKQEDWMKKELKLSEEQSKIFKERKDAFMSEMKPRWEEVNDLKDSLYRHLSDSRVPDSVVNYYTEKWTSKNRENDIRMFRHFEELRKQCSESQKPKFDSMVTKMVTRRWNRK